MKTILSVLGITLVMAAGMPALAQDEQPPAPLPAQDEEVAAAEQAGEEAEPTGPVSLEEMKKEREPAAEERGGKTTATQKQKVPKTQNAFVELTPVLGAVSIFDKSAVTLGTNVSFPISDKRPLFFEPAIFASFYSGKDGEGQPDVTKANVAGLPDGNTTLLHVDAGLRYDFPIAGSPLIPFARAAIGATLSGSDSIFSEETADEVSDGYLNQFYGGGVKLLINNNIMARADVGLTFQKANAGLYFLGAVALPL